MPKRRAAGVTCAQVRLDDPEDTVMLLLASCGCYGCELKALPEAEFVVRCAGRVACINPFQPKLILVHTTVTGTCRRAYKTCKNWPLCSYVG